jgi:DNA (cytosine-5)-methyltransferase 1
MQYINEFDANAAAWLRQLVEDKIIPEAHVDERSITEVEPSDLRGYTQCHFFAGIAGWPLALQLAGWPEDRPVWTASLPCQPFSSAGKQGGTEDERHLWPVFQRLVAECRPPAVFGEQVSSKIAREKWFPGVCLDLQAMGYPVTALDLCAPCAGEDGEGRTHRGDIEPIIIGAPHIRQRLYWVAYRGMADTESRGREDGQEIGRSDAAVEGQTGVGERVSGGSETSADHRMAQPRNDGARSLGGQTRHEGRGAVDTGATGIRQDHGTACPGGADPRSAGVDSNSGMANPPSDRRERTGQGAEAEEGRQQGPGSGGELPCGLEGRALHSGLGNPGSEEPQGHQRPADVELHGQEGSERPATPAGFWSDFDLIPCRDGKVRRIESGTSALSPRLSRGVVPSGDPGEQGYANETSEARVMRLKGYGNAICAPLAAMFIETCMEVIPHD